MKFYQPKTEELVRRLAGEGRAAAGLRLEPRDWDLWFWCKVWLSRLFMLGIGSHFLLQALRPGPTIWEGTPWQALISGVVMMVCAGRLGLRLHGLSFRLPMPEVLRYLPVPGRRILEWGRFEAVRHSGWIVWWSLLIAWSIEGRPRGVSGVLPVLSMAVLLFGVTFASACICTFPWFVRWHLAKLVYVPVVGGVIGYLVLDIGKAWDLPNWITSSPEALSWMLPTTWVWPEHLFGWGGLLALGWAVFGFWWWWRRPAVLGFVLDHPWEIVRSQEPEAAAAAETEDEARLEVPADLCGGGWVERLAWRFVPAKDRALAVALAPVDPRWTRVWYEGAIACAVLLLLAWLQRQPLQIQKDSNTAAVFLWIGVVVAALRTWPSSDLIPLATATLKIGYLRLPFFVGLPAGARDVLRIWTRLTAARAVASALLAIPAWLGMTVITGMPGDRYFAVVAVPEMIILWCWLGPILTCLRIQNLIKPRRGAFILDLICKFIMGFLIVGAAGASLVALFLLPAARQFPFAWPGWLLLGGMALSALCSYGVFEIFCWQLRSGKLDLVTAGRESD